MKTYTPGTVDDIGLFTWWGEMQRDGSIATAFAPSLYALAPFVRTMTMHAGSVQYEADERGWYAVTWLTPVMGGLSLGLWLREDVRGGKSEKHDAAFNLLIETIHGALGAFPVVLCFTTQPRVVELVKGLGFSHMGQVPGLWEGEACDTLYITRDAFAPLYEAWSTDYGRRR